jgi:hypothetical protein
VHEVGTVVFTVSAQFGVPVVPYMWALTRGITSYAREIVASLAEVERRPAVPRAARASGPVAAVERKRQRVRFGSKADILLSPRHVRFTPNNGRWAAHPSQHLAVGLWVHALVREQVDRQRYREGRLSEVNSCHSACCGTASGKGEAAKAMTELELEVRDGDITITLPGTSYTVTY